MVHHESIDAKLASDSGGAGWFDVIEYDCEFQVIDSDGGAVLHYCDSLEAAIKAAQESADRFDRAKLDYLKRQWRADPAWDIETTEGYEDFRDELYVFRLETELADTKQELRHIRSTLKPVAKYFAELASV